MSSRRYLLARFSGGLVALLSGCVGTRWWEDSESDGPDGGTEGRDHSENESGDFSTANERNQTNEEQSADEEENLSENNEGNEDKEESSQKPTDEETEIDRDEYEDQEVSDTEARSRDDIEIDADSQIAADGSATVTGTVTNVSDTSIDVVDLAIVFYGADDEYLSAQLVTIRDLGVDESEQFEAGITPDGAHGQPERVEITPDVYDRAD